MTDAAKELEAAALSLPRSERAKLAERLLSSLDDKSDVDEAWEQEVRERLESFRSGSVKETAADDVLDEARSRTEG
jgi:putative addiction module component (TIGR02574 family)